MVKGVLDVDVGAAIEQQLDDVQVTAIAGKRQGRPVVAKPGVDVHSLVQELPNSGCVSLTGRLQERVGLLRVRTSLGRRCTGSGRSLWARLRRRGARRQKHDDHAPENPPGAKMLSFHNLSYAL